MPVYIQATFVCDRCGQESAVTEGTIIGMPVPIPDGWRQSIMPDPQGPPEVYTFGPNCVPTMRELLRSRG